MLSGPVTAVNASPARTRVMASDLSSWTVMSVPTGKLRCNGLRKGAPLSDLGSSGTSGRTLSSDA